MKKGILIGITLITILGLASFSYASSNSGARTTIEEKKEILEQKVEEGTITKEQASEIETKLENCDGNRQEKIGQEYGICFGAGQGNGQSTEKTQGQANTQRNRQNNEDCTNQRKQNGKGQKQGNANCKGTGICKRVTE